MRRALRWLVLHAFGLLEVATILALVWLCGGSWGAIAAAASLALVSYADGMEQGIRRATGRRPEGGVS